MSLRNVRLVTFDATNTLLKFRVPPWEYYAIKAKGYGFKGTANDLKPLLLRSYKKTSQEHPNFGRDTIKWEEWWRKVVKSTLHGLISVNEELDLLATTLIKDFTTPKCWTQAEGGEDIINTLRKNNISIGIISNFDPRLYNILENISIKNNFDFIVTSYDVGLMKPDEKIFQHALTMSKNIVKPSQALHVGDDVEKDYRGAKKAGWNAVLVTENVKGEEQPAPRHVFQSIKELSQAINHNKLKL